VLVDLIAEELNYLAPLYLAGHQLDEADAVPGEQEAGRFGGDVMQLLAIPSARVHAFEDRAVEILQSARIGSAFTKWMITVWAIVLPLDCSTAGAIGSAETVILSFLSIAVFIGS